MVRLRIKTGFSIYCGAIKPTLIFYDFYWLSINDVMYELFVWSRWTLRVATRGQFFLDDTVYVDSDSKRIRQKFYQFFVNEKFKKILNFFLSAFYLIMCLIKSLKNFEKIVILKK